MADFFDSSTDELSKVAVINTINNTMRKTTDTYVSSFVLQLNRQDNSAYCGY